MGAVALTASGVSTAASARRSYDSWWYAAGVLLGSVLIVATAIRQPFNYDELTQIAPYGSNSIVEIVTATRQSPIDPLLGAMFQHLFGMGQLRQRLVPVLAGIATLVVLSLLFRRLRLGLAGAFGIWVLATAPLMVRYSAYTRPYALPMFFMLLFAYAVHRWLDEGRRRWLVVAGATAVALPLTRVPEPTVFLGVTAAVLAWASLRGRLAWSRTGPVIAVGLGVLVLIGVPMYVLLAYTADNFLDVSPTGVTGRLGEGADEIVTAVVPLLAYWMSWWPLSLAAIAVAMVLPASRRRLFGWLLWWPMLTAPVVFVLVYHFLNEYPFESLPYRARAAFFFVPAFVLVMVSLATVVADASAARWLRAGVALLLGGVLVGQLPLTRSIVENDAAPDFDKVSQVLTEDVPDDAIVLYGRPSPVGQSRQPFLGRPRYMGAVPYVTTVENVSPSLERLPERGPVYVLVNGQCASPGRCSATTQAWDEQVPGYRLAERMERITLYEPIRGQDGPTGVVSALRAFGDTLGPELGYTETLTAAALLQQQGDSARAEALVRRMYARASPAVAADIRAVVKAEGVDPMQ